MLGIFGLDKTRGWPALKRIHLLCGRAVAAFRKLWEVRSQERRFRGEPPNILTKLVATFREILYSLNKSVHTVLMN